MPDLDEPVRKDVQQEPTDELVCIERHDFRLVVIRVIPPAERNLVAFEFDQPVVADRDPVGVSAEIIDNVLSPLKRRLAVGDPLSLM